MEEKKLFLNVFENDASVSDVHLDDGFDFYTHLRRRCCVRPSLSLSVSFLRQPMCDRVRQRQRQRQHTMPTQCVSSSFLLSLTTTMSSVSCTK